MLKTGRQGHISERSEGLNSPELWQTMTHDRHHPGDSNWSRQLRSCGGALLMLVALCGGIRPGYSSPEEIETESQTEVQEFAHRLSDSGQRTPRCIRNDLATALVMPDATGGSPQRRPAERRAGSTDRSDHVLANGLCAPLRC
jgi:hypothetical protein